jgi:hypothetical protein
MGLHDYATVIYNPKNKQFIPIFDYSKKKDYNEHIDPKLINMLSKIKEKNRLETLYDMAETTGSFEAILEVYYFDETVNPETEFLTNYINHRLHKNTEIIEVGYDDTNMDFNPNIGYAELRGPVYEWAPNKFEGDIPDNELVRKFKELYEKGTRIWIRNWTPEEYKFYSKNGKWANEISDLELLYIATEYALPYENLTRGQIYESIKKEVYSRFF